MADVLGVIAAATQLGSLCLSLLDVITKIKGGNSVLESYQQQLQELSSLSTAISSNTLLHTTEIKACTHSILTLIKDNDLGSLLRRGWLARSWILISRDREFSEVFSSLEKKKTLLSLLIHNLQAQAIHDIQTSVTDMSQRSRVIELMAADNNRNSLFSHTEPASRREVTLGPRGTLQRSRPGYRDNYAPLQQEIVPNSGIIRPTHDMDQSLNLYNTQDFKTDFNSSHSSAENLSRSSFMSPSKRRISPDRVMEMIKNANHFAETQEGNVLYSEGNSCDRGSYMSNQLHLSAGGKKDPTSAQDSESWSSAHVGCYATRGSNMDNSRVIRLAGQRNPESPENSRYYTLACESDGTSGMRNDVRVLATDQVRGRPVEYPRRDV